MDREYIWQEAQADVFGAAAPSPDPVLLSIGAQPGAGKTRGLAHAMRALHPSQQFVPVIGDDLRRFHPDYARLSQSPDPEAMPVATADLSAWLVRRCLDHAAANHYSTAVEGTLRRPDVTLATMRQFHDAGATTHLVILAVPEVESWTGCIERYLSLRQLGRPARWTPQAAHDAGYDGTPRTLQAATSSPAVDRLSITTRNGQVLYDSHNPGHHPVYHARAALDQGRRTPPAPQVDDRLDYLASLARQLGEPAPVIDGIEHAKHLLTQAASTARANAATAGPWPHSHETQSLTSNPPAPVVPAPRQHPHL